MSLRQKLIMDLLQAYDDINRDKTLVKKWYEFLGIAEEILDQDAQSMEPQFFNPSYYVVSSEAMNNLRTAYEALMDYEDSE